MTSPPDPVIHPLGVIHGRFQVVHNDHLRYLLAGKARCRHLVVGISNPDPEATRPVPSDPGRSAPGANPLTYYERYRMLRAVLGEAGVAEEELSVVPFPINRPALLRHYVPRDAVFFLTIYDDWGREKRRLLAGLGLTTEVLWEAPAAAKGISASEVRAAIRAGTDWQSLVPPATAQLVHSWRLAARLDAPGPAPDCRGGG